MVHSAYLWTRTDCHNELGAEIQGVQWWTMANPFGKCVALHGQNNPQRIQQFIIESAWSSWRLRRSTSFEINFVSITNFGYHWGHLVLGTLCTPHMNFVGANAWCPAGTIVQLIKELQYHTCYFAKKSLFCNCSPTENPQSF
jgi:hypothetical protein